jgi:WD40 repeat protein
MAHYLIRIGVSHYAQGSDWALPGVPDDMRRVGELFASLGYRHVLPQLRSDPTVEMVRRTLHPWLVSTQRRTDDVVVVYYAGHGINSGQRHYLLCADSDERMLATTALATEDVGRMLNGSKVQHVLVILDCCFAGAGAGELAAVAHQLVRVRQTDERHGTGLWWMAAARPRDEAEENAFADSIAQAVRHAPPCQRQRFLDPAGLITAVNAEMSRCLRSQRARYGATDASGMPPFFPNPRFRSHLPPEGTDLETQRRSAHQRTLREHFGPRSRGVEIDTQPGWFFTGREQALTELVTWLADPRGDTRSRVVTGDPGSGKSAILGYLVALADPDYLRGIPPGEHLGRPQPPVGCISVAIHARAKTAEEVVTQLAQAAGVSARIPTDLVDELAAAARPMTVVIDALDEAGATGDLDGARQLIAVLLRPLSLLPGVRLLVGTRRPLVPALSAESVVIDLDAPPYTSAADIAVYTERLLLAGAGVGSGSPYQAQPGLAREVAAAIARQAHPSFLVARTIVRGLLQAPPVDTGQTAWWTRLPREAGQAFDAYLASFGDRAQPVRRLLTPLAYAHGDGLPWSIWAAVTAALSGKPCGDDDLTWLLDTAGAFVVEATIEGRSVYRLYHEALAEHLRNIHPMPAREVHARIARILKGGIPPTADHDTPDWQAAHPYVRQHAAAGGTIDSYLADPQFVLAADIDRLLVAAQQASTPEGTRIAFAVERAAGRLRPPADAHRAAYLQLAARKSRADTFAGRLDHQTSDMAWSIPWTHLLPMTPHRIIGHHKDGITSIALAETDDPTIAVTRSTDETLLWNPRYGTPLGALDSPDNARGPVTIPRSRDGRPLAVTGHSDGTIQRWDLRTATPLGPPLPVLDGKVLALATAVLLDGSRAIIAAGSSRLAIWNLDTGASISIIETGHEAYDPRTVATLTDPEGRAFAITGGFSGNVQTWDLNTGQHIGTVYCGEPIERLAVAMLPDGRPVAAVLFRWTSDRFEVWDVARGERLAGIEMQADCSAIGVVPYPSPLLAVATGRAGSITIHDLATGTQVHPPLRGHESEIWALACSPARDDGSVTLLSAGGDRTVRLWWLSTDDQARTAETDDHDPIAGARCLLASAPDSADGFLVISPHTNADESTDDGDAAPRGRHMLRWNLNTGKPAAPPIADIPARICSLEAARLSNGHSAAIASLRDHPPRVWDLNTGHLLGDLGVLPARVAALPATPGRAATAVMAVDSTLQLWDIEEGAPLNPGFSIPPRHALVGTALLPHAVAVTTSISTFSLGDIPAVVSAWDLCSGTMLGQFAAETRYSNKVAATATPDGRLIAIVAHEYDPEGQHLHENSKITAWDIITGQELGSLFDGPGSAFHLSAAALPDGRVIAAVAYHGGCLQIFDVDLLRIITTIDLDSTIWSIHIAADHKLLIVSTSAGLTAIHLS